jgi:hypothetical protein
MPAKLAKLAKLQKPPKQVNVWHLFLIAPVLLFALELCGAAFQRGRVFDGAVVCSMPVKAAGDKNPGRAATL